MVLLLKIAMPRIREAIIDPPRRVNSLMSSSSLWTLSAFWVLNIFGVRAHLTSECPLNQMWLSAA